MTAPVRPSYIDRNFPDADFTAKIGLRLQGQLWQRLGSELGPRTRGRVVAQGMFHPNYPSGAQGLRWFDAELYPR